MASLGIYGANPTFNSLFRLLDEFDNYKNASEGNNQVSNRPRGLGQSRLFTPKFDAYETKQAYELHGELPGIDRENVVIEFTEPQTIVIRGRVERKYTNKPTETHSEDHAPHKATVEDEATEQANEADSEKPKTEVTKHSSRQVQKAPAERYLISERMVGEFSRTFSFPSRIDQDAVSANLNNGVLTVVVPKAKKTEARRIAIN